ncbi:MAG: hypothetical protein NT030_08150 [Candidatus Saganbacteria bacterium]|nr:hypothetical protein [Candidatus Saganbacteria bacterium]
MKIKLAMLISLGLFVAGCALVDVTKTAKGYYDKTDANEIEILVFRPDRPFLELGTVIATGFAVDESAKMHNAIRTKASSLGAHAVVLTGGGIISGGPRGQMWVSGVAIRYKQ